MVYAYYDKNSQSGIITTNLKAIVGMTGYTYDQLRYLFRNGKTVEETDTYIILRSELIKKKTAGNRAKRPKPEPRDTGSKKDYLLR